MNTGHAVTTPAPTLGTPAPESSSGLEPWAVAELPAPPRPRGRQWIAAIGPGVIVLGVSIGSGEFLLGPASFVKHGLTLLWVTSVATLLQTVFNLELMRYTMATGEPACTGFMRTRPRAGFWAWTYAGLFVLQVGWPGWAGAAAGAFFFLGSERVAGPEDAGIVYWIGVATFLGCVAILLVGRKIERTLEVLNWILVTAILTSFLVLALLFVAPGTWIAALSGYIGFDPTTRTFAPLPSGVDYFLLGAVAAFRGAGGVINLMLSNWARDKGYGMGSTTGYIPAVFGAKKVHLAHTGSVFVPSEEALRRWRGWWRLVRVDQWGIFFIGGLLGMGLPALLYVTFLAPGQDIRGLGIAAALADAMEARFPLMGGVIAFMGAWILFKTQLDVLDGLTRATTDMLWTSSRRLRAWRGGDVRVVYYGVLLVVVVWGAIALRLAQPILLLQLAANIGGVVFVVAGVHLYYVNTRLLPVELRPGAWPRIGLVALVLFYGTFSVLSFRAMLA